jgi:hypothetical protein
MEVTRSRVSAKSGWVIRVSFLYNLRASAESFCAGKYGYMHVFFGEIPGGKHAAEGLFAS